MDNRRKLMQLYFLTEPEVCTHYHQDPELFYLLSGHFEVKIDDAVYQMKKGDILLINANKRHTLAAKGELLMARFEIDFHLLAEQLGSMQLLFWCNSVIDKNEAFQELRILLDKIIDRYFEQENKDALRMNALYYETLYVLAGNFLVKSDDIRLNVEDSQDRVRIRQIQNYIQANYQSQISLNDLADRLFLSNAYLSKYIKKHLGLTFMEYLNNVRLFHAVDELLYSKKNITHIAMDNGFPTSAAFTKAFRDVHGESPSEYRKLMQEENSTPRDRRELTKEEELKIVEYLKLKRQEDEAEISDSRICHMDAAVITGKTNDFGKAVVLGDAYTILQSDVQEQLKELKQTTGIQYVKIWNILSKEHCFLEKKGYNFRKLDLVLDFMVENHMKPYLELGHKPTLFMYTPERSVKGQEEERKIYQYSVFEEIIKQLCTHLVNRYGIEELESWYFAYWNDPQLNMTEAEGKYYPYFEMIYRTLKEISPDIRVGGASLILGYELDVCSNILNLWKQRNITPDFFSVCSFQYIAVTDHETRYGRKSIDSKYMKNQIDILQNAMDESGIGNIELHVDEWNFTISNRNVLNDSCEQGAYILKNYIDMEGTVDFMAYWHALDLYSDYYDTNTILNGDSGLISRDGIRKPSFYAFSFINRLLPYVIYKDENAIVTTNKRGRYVIGCHNFKKLSSRYVFTEEDEIKVRELDNYMEDMDPLERKFCISNVKNGSYIVKMHYVNKENGSVQDLWKQMDYTKGLAKEELEYLKNSAIPSIIMRTVLVEDGVLEIENVLKAQEIRMLDIQYQYSL
ncbi:helix-turn-helix domain-containing protein [Clostridium sp. AF19-22AC]|jgi:beta-xylosidase/AraC-like DNA-binding protein|uniref:GH39 family glycosyl hydrolase n=1 Tax=Clostridia TaxID=186801 RepID=UPI000E51F59F|nr:MULTISPECIES: helix-turn-helix domain-containing protein [Clostridia]RHR33144.1 helix-turn-helix domain-containing protein [Clostridium sp. AF19-22AC]